VRGLPGYIAFGNVDISANVDINPNNDTPYQGPGGAFLDQQTLMTLCEDPAQGGQCSHFNSLGYLKTFPANASLQSYISNTTCGTNAKLSISSGTALSPPGTTYVVCTAISGIDASYILLATFNLPPFLIERACDQNPACCAYMVDTAGTQGWLLGLLGGGEQPIAFIKLPPTAHGAQIVPH
jgi:hypothetical protein